MGVWEYGSVGVCECAQTAFNEPRENKSLVKTRNDRYTAADIEMD
jgi:hypothetical protein